MSEEAIAAPPGAHAEGGPGAVPAPQTDPADAARSKRINNATTFLKNPQVRASPLERRVNFLKSKGLSPEEISEAFSRAGQPQSVDAIQKIVNTHTSAATTAPKTSTSTAATAQPQQPQQPNVVYVQQPMYHPPPPPPPPPKPPAWGWKDYFIGATLAAAGTLGAVKAVQYFAPFDIVWRDGSGGVDGGARSGSNRGVAAPTSPKSRRRGKNATSSDSEAVNLAASRNFAQSGTFSPTQSQAFAPPQPPVPPAAPPATAAPPAQSTEAAAPAPSDTAAEVEQLKKEVAELTEKLDKERKEKAEMAVTNAKVKGQVTQLSRANEKSTAELARLSSLNAALREENEKLKAAAAPPAPAEEGAAKADEAAASPPPSAQPPSDTATAVVAEGPVPNAVGEVQPAAVEQ